MFSGWGVRTVAESELRFNPMSYHNGVDLAARQRAAGGGRGALRRQGVRAAHPHRPVRGGASLRPDAPAGAVLRIPAQADARRRCNSRWPARRRPCSAGATFLLLQSVLGITIDALDRQIVLSHPVVPDDFEEISVRNLTVGDASVDFTVRRHAGHSERQRRAKGRESGPGDSKLRGSRRRLR